MKRHLLPAIFAALFVTPVSAITYTWNGAGADNNISTAGNWVSGPPVSDILNTDLIFAGLIRLTPNFTSTFSANSVTFNNTAGAFNIGGSGLNLGLGGITNNDTQAQTITTSVSVSSATSSFNATAGALVFNAGVLLTGSKVLELTGTHAITLALAGSGTANKTGLGALNLYSSSTSFGVDLNLNAGTTTLTAGTTQTFSSGSTITLAGGHLTLNESAILDGGQITRSAGNLTIAAGKTLTVQNGGDVLYTGVFTNSTASNIAVTGAGSTFTTAGGLILNGGVAVTVAAGGALSSQGFLDLGVTGGGGGSISVTGAGSSVASTSNSYWGQGVSTVNVAFSNNATGTLAGLEIARSIAGTVAAVEVSTGADVTSSSLRIAADAVASTASFTVMGSGSTWTVNGVGSTVIGAASASTASFVVTDSGTFTSGTGNITLGATGSVNVSNYGIFNANGNMTVDGGLLTRSSTGVFNITAGKTLTVQGGGDANFSGGAFDPFLLNGGNITVTGAGSTFTNTQPVAIYNGSTVSILAGGYFDTTSYLDIGVAGTTGSLIVDGAGTIVSAQMSSFWGASSGTANVTISNGAIGNFGTIQVASSVGSTGTVQVSSNADVSLSGNLSVGNSSSGSVGLLTVQDSGTSWTQTNSSTVMIGAEASSDSTGALNVLNGATFVTSTGGLTVNATGSLTVTGATFASNGNFNINGGQLNTSGLSTFQHNSGTFAVQAGGDAIFANIPSFLSTTAVSVTGIGSTLSGAGALAFNNSALSISAGGVVSAGTFLNLGVITPTVVTVDGAGSQLNSNTNFSNTWGSGGGTPIITFSNGASGTFGLINLGLNGNTTNAVLNIQSGADVNLGAINIANTTNTTQATVNVSGPGSTLTTSGTILLGAASGSTATLNVISGGAVTTTGGFSSFILNPTSNVNLDGGTLSLSTAIQRNGGSLNFYSGILSLSENLTVGTTGLLGGDLMLGSTRKLIVGSTHTTTIDAFSTLTLDGGSLTTNALVNNGTLDFRRGTLAITGGGGFEIGTGALGSDVILGTGANLQVTNDTVIAEGASFQTDGGSFTTGLLDNFSLIEHTRGSFTLLNGGANNAGADLFIQRILTTNGVLNNVSGGQIVLTNGTGRISGSGSVSNSGLIRGDGTIATALTNAASGVIRAEAGKSLRVNGAFANNAGTLSLEGGTLEFAGGVVNSNTGFISGRGALNAALLTNNGVMAFSAGNTDIRGDVTNASGARIVTSGAGATTTFYDDVVHNGAEIFTSAGANTVFFGSQSGAGNFTGTGTVHYIGDLRPGNSPATVTYGGDVMLSSTTTLTMELGGVTAGVNYDQLAVAGSLLIDGALTISLINGFMPALGNVFQLFDAETITGAFDSIQLPSIAEYLAWNTSSLHSTGEISVISNLTPIQTWRLFYFSNSANVGDGADNHDFDKDGIPNLIEYALGLDPLIPSTAGQPELGFHEDGPLRYITLTITRPLSATDVNYRVEVGPSPASFSAGSYYSSGGDVPTNAHTTQVSRTDDGVMETIIVRDNTELSTASARFLRLKVVNPAEP